MSRYIDADKLNGYEFGLISPKAQDLFHKIINNAPTVIAEKQNEPTNGDLISKSVFDQIRWERDVAIEQLHDLGYELGEKPRTDAEWIFDGWKTKCSNCGKAKLSHRVCPNCGFYKGRQVVTPKAEKTEE